MSLNETAQRSISQAGIVRVRNALNPLLWASAVIPTVSWSAAYLFKDDLFLRYFLVGLGSVPILATMVAYFIYMFNDPDRLQSEEFVLRQQELSMIERKGIPSLPVPGEASELDEVVIASPHSGRRERP